MTVEEKRMNQTTEAETIRAGDVVRYKSERENRWCREETAIADLTSVLVDTFWGCGGDSHVLTASERATAEVLFNLADYRELTRAERGSWERYAPTDRQVITSQHGLQRRLFVRHGAFEDRPTMIENAQRRVSDAEGELRSAERQLEAARRDLAELVSS